jgi:hypothetical protein
MTLRTCINTATTCTMEPIPGCKACQEYFEGKTCIHEGKSCPTADGKPEGFPTCPCLHCYPRAQAVRTFTSVTSFNMGRPWNP